MSGLDLVTLRLLVAIEELGSINAAAESVGITQPAASARLREFEARWRLAIATRTPRGTSLTTDGVAVAAWASKVLSEADAMVSGLQALSSSREGDLVIAASLTIAEFVLPRWISRLRVARPDVSPQLRVINSVTVLDLVARDEVQLGFVETAQPPTAFEHRVIGYDTVVVAVHPGHPWARRSYPIPVDQLLTEAYVLREQGSGTRSTFERALRHLPEVAIEASSTQTLIGAAVAGVGPAVLSALALRAHLERGELVAVRTVLDLRRPLTAVWRRGHRLSGPARDLLAIAGSSTILESATSLTDSRGAL